MHKKKGHEGKEDTEKKICDFLFFVPGAHRATPCQAVSMAVRTEVLRHTGVL